MKLKPEVIQVLVRERAVSEAAIARLRERTKPLEQKYGWSTETFLEKFNAGAAGDESDFFTWYALAEAMKDWQKIRNSLDELLTGAEPLRA
ncbi:MAG: hypothetical protein D6790_01675 [Caldilineae bacterium]|nr:MAG: hypothetical protein D6790_01675 [Caldilineae bacterium]